MHPHNRPAPSYGNRLGAFHPRQFAELLQQMSAFEA